MSVQIGSSKVESVSSHSQEFETGAFRSSASGRIDPEASLSPLVVERLCEYLEKCSHLENGEQRALDNWQQGMPPATYIKGLLRHTLHAWQRHRGWKVLDPKAAENIEEDLCAILFNAQGYLHSLLEDRYAHGLS